MLATFDLLHNVVIWHEGSKTVTKHQKHGL